ncbi:hypothetical protein [Aeromonas allosaccharophila]|uniref:hypothetical protein n=1 Tax=Aeromonas allosaccharophila TaxID=656 RepID=UPI002B46473B|nr:hypothetical protein [Aeromonas allosaccharophila]
MKPLSKVRTEAIHAQFIEASNLTHALYYACDTDSKYLPYSKLVTLLHPLAKQLHQLECFCTRTRWSKIAHRMNRYLSVLVEVLIGNQINVSVSNLTILLGPLIKDFRLVKQEYAKIDSSSSVAQETNRKSEDAKQKLEEAELAKPLPSQKQPMRDVLVNIPPPENINDLIASGLTGKPEDIWTRYQAYLPPHLTQEEVKIAYDSFIVMLEELLN